MEPHTWTIEWNDGMSVGIPEIDEDHKQFIVLIDGLNRAIVDRMVLGELKARLQLILESTERHFEREERLFREWKYPEADYHAAKHAQTTKKLQAVMEKFINYDFQSEWINAGMQVKDILIDHFLTEDMKYAKFYRESRNAPPEK